MSRALVLLAAAAVSFTCPPVDALAGTPTLRDETPTRSAAQRGPVRHTVWQPVSGGQPYYGHNAYGQPATQSGVDEGFQHYTAPLAGEDRKSIGSELKKGAEKLINETERALRNTGEAFEGTAKNIGDGVERAFTGGAPQATPAPQGGGFLPYSYNNSAATQSNTAPPFSPAPNQQFGAQPQARDTTATQQHNQQPYAGQQHNAPQAGAGQYAPEERSVVVQPGQQSQPASQGPQSQAFPDAGAEHRRQSAQWSNASTGLEIVPPALGDPRGAQQPAGGQNDYRQNPQYNDGQYAAESPNQQQGGTGLPGGPAGSQNPDGGLVSIPQNPNRGSAQQPPQYDQGGADQAERPWYESFPDPASQSRPDPSSTAGANEGWEWEDDPQRADERAGREAGFASGAGRPENPASWGDDIAGPSGQGSTAASEVLADKPPYGALVFATLVSVFSLGWNVYLGFNYLDARNKYRAALRRSGREYSELVDA